MASKTVFSTKHNSLPETDVLNAAGGKAYSVSDEHALAQYVVTACFNRTYYASDAEQLEAVKKLAGACGAEFVARAAVYGHEVAGMKDVPAYLLAHLAGRKDPDSLVWFSRAFPRVVTNGKMLMNFVQVIRSGVVGRRSFGNAPKRAIREWFESRTGNQIFTSSIGANPSMADIIKLVHPKPDSDEKRALYAYIIDRPYDGTALPPKVQDLEGFKQAKELGVLHDVPDVPFQMLTALNLTPEEWVQVGRNLPWNALRMNLNTLARHGVFKVKGMTEYVASKLADADEVRRHNVFPYQLMTAYLNVDGDVPQRVRNAIQDAMEVATENVPDFGRTTAVCIDTSGSMGSPVTGHRKGSTSKVRCVDVAALVGASVARKNKDTVLLPFDTRVHDASSINVRDSVMTNADKLRKFGGGGTDCASALRALNHAKYELDRPRVVIFVSDNESWYNGVGSYAGYRGTGMAQEWESYKRKAKDAKLVLIDIEANANTQVKEAPDVLNVGGFSDKVFEVIKRFVGTDGTTFVDVVKSVEL